jgi:hypothetical protein
MSGTKTNPTAQLMAALARRYPVGQFALLEQVANGTGSMANRWCDAIAMSLWPSRGLELFGFELKVYRGDWLRELKAPRKAEAIAAYCHRWYVVTPQGLVREGELPPAWGLLELRGGKLHCVRESPLAEPKAFDYPMLAAILRRASESMVPKSALQALAKAEAEELTAARKDRDGLELDELRKLKKLVEIFEGKSGLSLQWSGPRVGDEFRRFREADRMKPFQQLRHQRDQIRRIVDEIDTLLEKQPGAAASAACGEQIELNGAGDAAEATA